MTDLFAKEPAPPTRRDRLYRALLNRRIDKITKRFNAAEAGDHEEAKTVEAKKARRVLDAQWRQIRRETARKREIMHFKERNGCIEITVNLNGSGAMGEILLPEAVKVADILDALEPGKGLRLEILGGMSKVLIIPKDVVPQAKQLFRDWADEYLARPAAGSMGATGAAGSTGAVGSVGAVGDLDLDVAAIEEEEIPTTKPGPRSRPSSLAERLEL